MKKISKIPPARPVLNDQQKNNKKHDLRDYKLIFLIIFGILIFGLRLVNINEAIYDDEANFAYSLTVMDVYGFNQEYPSPQLFNLLYKPFLALFGLTTWVFRIIPWIFGIINTFFVYFLARRHWNKNVAFWATLLMLVSFYPTLASLQFDVEGSLVMFSALLFFFSYLEYEKALSRRSQILWQFLSGVGLAFAIISKYNSVYLVLALALYSLITRHWSFKQSFRDLFPIYLSGFILFLLSLMVGFLSAPNSWLQFVPIISWSEGFTNAYRPQLFSILGSAIYFLWATPLLIGFYILSLFKRKKEPKDILLLSWITLGILFYTFIVNYGSIDRYLMNTIPALAILGGCFLGHYALKRHHFFLIFLAAITFLSSFFILNLQNIKYVPRFPTIYLTELKQLNLHFLFSYTSASGPTFGVSFATIFVTILISFLCILLYLTSKKSQKMIYLILFFAIALAFNIFLVTEYLFHPTGVDVSKTKWDMINYAKTENLPLPLYSTDSGILWYFDHRYWGHYENVLGIPDNEIGQSPQFQVDTIKKRGGTFLLLHWPPLPKDSPVWEVLKFCSLEKRFLSKEIVTGEIYRCPAIKNEIN